jgi:hypothetical protein
MVPKVAHGTERVKGLSPRSSVQGKLMSKMLNSYLASMSQKWYVKLQRYHVQSY